MAEQVRTERVSGRATGDEPSWMELLDPAALEARLSEARARRAEALAGKNGGGGEARSQDPIRPAPISAPSSLRPATARKPVSTPPASAAKRPAEPVYVIPARPAAKAQTTVPHEPLIAEPRIVPAKPGARNFTTLLLSTIFVVGLLGGGVAALLAPPAFRQQIADMIAPASKQQATEPSIASTSIDVEAVPVARSPVDQAQSADTAVIIPPGNVENPATDIDRPTQVGAPATAIGNASAPQAVVSAPELLASTTAEAFPESPGADTGWVENSGPGLVEMPGSAGAPSDLVSRLASLAPRPVEGVEAGDEAPPALEPVSLLETARVFVHFPQSSRSTATAAVDTLRSAGAGEAESMAVGFSIGSSNVRYYHAADRDAAMAVVEILSSSMPDAPELRDFTDYRPQPNPGVIEAWLAGDSPRAPVTTPRSADVSSAPQAASPTGEAEAEAVERILMQRTVERMLREQQLRN